MLDQKTRGSEKLMAAWSARRLSEESVGEIAAALDESPATVDSARVVGGEDATGIHVTMSYDGDDVPRCGNDILFWLHWHRKYGGVVRPPRIIINGTPYPDLVTVHLGFGDVGPGPLEQPQAGGFGG
jgi:hypothetical protein